MNVSTTETQKPKNQTSFSFPLYDMLNTPDLPAHEMTSLEKDKLVGLIESLDVEGRESILLLVKKHQAVQQQNSDKLPYGGKKVKKDLKFDLTEVPNQLRHILLKFALLRSSHMDEIKAREAEGAVAP